MTEHERENLDTVRRLLAALSERAPIEELGAFFHEDVVQRELPNRLTPEGATRGRAELLAGAERGRQVTTREHYEILSHSVTGDLVALEVAWSATLAVPLGNLPAGGVMRAHLAMFVELRDGRVAAQRNYDCFEPF